MVSLRPSVGVLWRNLESESWSLKITFKSWALFSFSRIFDSVFKKIVTPDKRTLLPGKLSVCVWPQLSHFSPLQTQIDHYVGIARDQTKSIVDK